MFKTLRSNLLGFLVVLASACPGWALSFDSGEAASGAQAGDIVCTDCVDGTDLADTITLDAALTISGSSVTVSSHVLVSGNLTIPGANAITTDTDDLDIATHVVVVGNISLTTAGNGITTAGAAQTNRVGMVEGKGNGMVTSTNVLLQVSSTAVTGDATIDFTDYGLKDYAAAPQIYLSVLYDNTDDTILGCTYHTVAATGFVIECTMSTGDGVAQATAADGSARQVNWMAVGLAP